MKITIIGAGALGTAFAYLLHDQGYGLSFLVKDKQTTEALSQGFTIKHQDISLKLKLPVSHDPAILRDSDYIFIFVKAYSTADLMKSIASAIAPSAKIISLQNGLNNYDFIKKCITTENIAMGTTSIGAYKLNSTTTNIAGIGNITIGNNHPDITDILSATGAELILTDNPMLAIWEKGIINAGINPIAALLGITNGEILQNEYTKDLQSQVIRESTGVAQKMHYDLTYEEMIKKTYAVCRQTATNRCSMLQDLAAKRKTEIEQINGVIIQQAKQYNLESPINLTLYELIKAKESTFK